MPHTILCSPEKFYLFFFICTSGKVCSMNFEPPLFRVPCLPTLSSSMDYLNTIYNEWIYHGVELHNLMNISNPLTFRVKTFQLSLSMKSQVNINNSGPKKYFKIFKCLIITDNTSHSRSSPLILFQPGFFWLSMTWAGRWIPPPPENNVAVELRQ